MSERRPTNVISIEEYKRKKEERKKKPVVVPLFTGYLKRVK